MHDKVPVLNIPQQIFTCAPKTETNDFQFIEEIKGLFAPFIPEVCLLAGIMGIEEAEIPSLTEFITAQFRDSDCRASVASVEKPNTYLNVHGDGVLVRCSPFERRILASHTGHPAPSFPPSMPLLLATWTPW